MSNKKNYNHAEVSVLNALQNASDRLTSDQLVAITGINKRSLHEIISRLQSNGQLIIGGKSQSNLGYKIATTSADLDAYFRQEQRQIESLQARINNMRKYSGNVGDYKQRLAVELQQY